MPTIFNSTPANKDSSDKRRLEEEKGFFGGSTFVFVLISLFCLVSIILAAYNAIIKETDLGYTMLIIAGSLYVIQSSFVNYVYLDIMNVLFYIIQKLCNGSSITCCPLASVFMVKETDDNPL